MKKTFPIIVVLITLSLTGIIWVQVSWLKSMVVLRQDQVYQKIEKATIKVSDDLRKHKLTYMSTMESDPLGLGRNMSDPLRRNSIGFIFDTKEIAAKIRKALNDEKLQELNFEYAIAAVYRTSGFYQLEKQTYNYELAASDSVRNAIVMGNTIVSPSGSYGENLTPDETLIVVALNWKRIVMRSLTGNFILSGLFTLIILAAFYLTVYTMIRQKKLGDIKNDFINNMTHELKTPIATISLAVDAIKNEKVQSNVEKLHYFSGIIKEENQRMNKQVETILKASQFDKQEVELEKTAVHVHEVIHSVADNFILQLQDKGGGIELQLNAVNDMIFADEVHFANLVNNLIDNGIKYSKENVPVRLVISTLQKDKKIVMRFQDNGIGMNKDTQKRVFEKFYRAHTGNIHNVKGFGLGLSYVKSVTQSHQGNVKLESTLGKGSTFILEFPVMTNAGA